MPTDRAQEGRPVESCSDEELELRALWMSRLVLGGFVTPELQPFYAETRSYEAWLAAGGYRLV